MRHIQLGSSDLMVSPISIGCWSFGSSADDYWGEQDQKDVNELVNEAIETGVNFFDTAYNYNSGKSEISLGMALGKKRELAVICTKTPLQASPEAFETELVKHLGYLKTDYVDILMLHWPTRDIAKLEMNLLAMKSMVDKGLVRYAGVSNFSIGTMEKAHALGVNFIANQIAYNLISRAPEIEIVPFCLKHSISITAYMPLMQGVLTGKYNNIEDIPERRRRTVQFDVKNNPFVDEPHTVPPADRQVMDVVAELKRLAPEVGMTVSQLALAWCINKPAVGSAIVGCRNIEQLLENKRAAEIPLPREIIESLDKASQPVLDIIGNTVDIFGRDRIW